MINLLLRLKTIFKKKQKKAKTFERQTSTSEFTYTFVMTVRIDTIAVPVPLPQTLCHMITANGLKSVKLRTIDELTIEKPQFNNLLSELTKTLENRRRSVTVFSAISTESEW